MNELNQTRDAHLAALEDELHYLNQISKYLNYLYQAYTVGKLKNDNRTWYTKVGMKNCDHEIERVKKEMEQIQLNET